MLALATGCSVLRQSDKAFVADQTAARVYHEDRYERACVQVKGPVTCAKMQEALNLLLHHEAGTPVGLIPLANKVQQIGALPPEERKELITLMNAVRSLP